MKLDKDGRPICCGLGFTRPCGIALHPGYTICYLCKRPYDGDELRWAKEQWEEQAAYIRVAQAFRVAFPDAAMPTAEACHGIQEEAIMQAIERVKANPLTAKYSSDLIAGKVIDAAGAKGSRSRFVKGPKP